MNKKILRTTGVVAITVLAAAAAIAFTPFGEFLQSSLIQSTYNKVDSGIYIGQEKTENNEKNLRAQQGVTLRSEAVREGSVDYITVYVKAHTDKEGLQADAFKAVLDYDKSRLSLENITGGALSTVSVSSTVDADFSQVLKDAAGKETGTVFVGIDKATEFTKPSEELLKVKFRALDGMKFADITVRTLRMYKRADMLDTTNQTLYLNKGETADTTAEKLTVTLAGTTVTATEVSTTDGGKVRTEIYKEVDGTTIKTVVTTFNAQGKIVKVVTTMANGDSETREYTYKADGSYTLVITTKVGSKTTSLSESYDATGKLMARNTDATTSTVVPDTATGSTIKDSTTGGVTTAVNSTTSTTDSNVNSTPATTTGTACTPAANEKFNDTIGHWSESIVESARQKCIISGKSLGRFAPDEPVTRAELTKIAVEAFKVLRANGTTGFSDVSDSEWYGEYVRAARLADIVNGYQDGTFRPNTEINRAEALKIVLEAGVKTNKAPAVAGLENTFSNWMSTHPTYTYVQFPDVKVVDWFGKYVLTAFQQSIVRGYNDRGTEVFRPGQSVTRAEAVKMIMSILQ